MTLIDVCSFGAKGDGTTDDSAAFQAAVDALRQTSGSICASPVQVDSEGPVPGASE